MGVRPVASGTRRLRIAAGSRCASVRAWPIRVRRRGGRAAHSRQLPEQSFLVVDPAVKVPTAELFQSPELTRDTPATTISRFLAGETTANAFRRRCRAALSGSGACAELAGWPRCCALERHGCAVFVALIDADHERALLADLPTDFRAVVARGVNRCRCLRRSIAGAATGNNGFGWGVAKW